jgi:nitroimidazol reductase NimA-like FMN-containing flavoprotein (pyridoxamine 5'-phosphate oxidase superfamily)
MGSLEQQFDVAELVIDRPLPRTAHEAVVTGAGGTNRQARALGASYPRGHEAERSPVYDRDVGETIGATAHDRGIDFVEIDRDGCMRMLAAASGGVGRIALSVSPPMIRPVNYAFDDQTQSVAFRSALGSKLREGLSSGTAAFEIDGTDPVDQTGWSVIIVGEVEEVTDPAEIERLEDFELEPWAPGVKTHWVRIRTTSASGRRIVHDMNYFS